MYGLKDFPCAGGRWLQRLRQRFYGWTSSQLRLVGL